jgi:acyl transferase domain-containing protein
MGIGKTRRAAVSFFGYGGSNAHATIEQPGGIMPEERDFYQSQSIPDYECSVQGVWGSIL